MYKLELEIYDYLKSIYSDMVNGELPLNFDFANKLGVYFEIKGASDGEYKSVATLNVHFYGMSNFKIDMLKLIDLFHSKLNKYDFELGWITPKVIYLIDAKEPDKEHKILTYDINLL